MKKKVSNMSTVLLERAEPQLKTGGGEVNAGRSGS